MPAQTTPHSRDEAAYEACRWLIDQGYAPSIGDLRRLADECFPRQGSFASYWQRIAVRWVDGRAR